MKLTRSMIEQSDTDMDQQWDQVVSRTWMPIALVVLVILIIEEALAEPSK
jgi:hypothetical protein